MGQFEILDRFSLGKLDGDGYSEDRLIVGAGAVGVIDGSRGPDYRNTDVLAEILAQGVEAFEAAHEPLATLDGLAGMARAVKARAGIETMGTTGGFVFCVYVAARREIWRLGDCLFAIDGRVSENSFVPEGKVAAARAGFLRTLLELGASPEEVMADPGYDSLIDPMLRRLCLFLNDGEHPFGIGAITGDPVPERFLEVVPVPAGSVVEISSDGYPGLEGSFTATEARLQALLAADPMCIGENLGAKGLGPGRVSYDDRSYVRFETV